MTAVVPLSDLARRIPIVGKLRSGVFKGNRPQSIDTWRLTTSSEEFATNFARVYGGDVQPMTNRNSPHTNEVISEATEVSIALINDGYSIGYELWSAGGCQRRCDGVTAEVLQTSGPDDVEYVPSPCICDRKGQLDCSLKSRLTMVLPDLPFRGGVVYETGSKNFAEESQGMLQLLSQMQASGVTRGVLRLEKRTSTGNRKFTVAVVGVKESMEAIAAGAAGMQSLGRAEPERQALNAPPSGDRERSHPSGGEAQSPDEGQIVEAEVIENPQDYDETMPGADDGDGSADPVVLDPADRTRMRAAFFARISGLGLDYGSDVKPWLVVKYDVDGWSELSDGNVQTLYNSLTVPGGSRSDKEDAGERFKAAVQAVNKEGES